MQFKKPISIAVLTDAFPDLQIRGQLHYIYGAAIASFAEPSDIVYADTEQWLSRALRSSAAAIVTTPSLAQSLDIERADTKVLLVHSDPLGIFEFVLEAAGVEREPMAPEKCPDYTVYRGCQICSDAWIANDAIIGHGTAIGPNAYIGPRVVIGMNCIIQKGCKLIWNVTLGDNVIVQSNSVIGGSPFFYHKDPIRGNRPLPRIGGVRLGAGVAVGSGTCIDRGVLEDTVIGPQTVIDNLVQIGHGSRIGKNTVIAAHAAIAGHVTVGERVRIMGQAGITPNVTIASDTIILGRTVISRSILTPGKYVGSRGRSIEAESRRETAITGIVSNADKIIEIFSSGKDDLIGSLWNLVEAHFSVDRTNFSMDSSFAADFGADSLDTVELRIAVEKKFNVELPDDYERRIRTFRDLFFEIAQRKGQTAK